MSETAFTASIVPNESLAAYVVPAFGSNGRNGAGRLLVAEGDRMPDMVLRWRKDVIQPYLDALQSALVSRLDAAGSRKPEGTDHRPGKLPEGAGLPDQPPGAARRDAQHRVGTRAPRPLPRPAHRHRTAGLTPHSAATGEPFEDTYRWTLPDGRHVWMLDRARATRWDPERREGEFHGAMVDVTDLMEGRVSREG